MDNKNISIIIGALAIIILAIGAVYFYNQPPLEKGSFITSSYDPKTQGKIIFGVTDAAEEMNGISSIFITLNKI